MFNIASDRCVVLQESLIGPTAPLRYVTSSPSVVNPLPIRGLTRPKGAWWTSTRETKTGDTGSPSGTSSFLSTFVTRYNSLTRTLPSRASRGARRRSQLTVVVVGQGYEVIPIPEECQRGYGINFVNLGNSHLVCCDEKTKALLEAHPQFRADGGRVTYMPYDGVTAMYGGPHCSSQLARIPRAGGSRSAPKSEASLGQESVLREDVRLVIPTELPHKQSVQEQVRPLVCSTL